MERIAERHARDLAELQRAQAQFARANPMPQRLDFPDVGTLLLHESALDGPIDHADLWVRYTYVNTTDHPIEEVRVSITLSATGSQEQAVEMPLKLPLSFRFSPDSSYTTSARIPTEGLHLQPGWSWSIRPRAVTSAVSRRG